MTTEQKPWTVLTTVQFETWRFLSKQFVIIWNWILLNPQLLCPWSIGVNSGQPHQSVVQMRELEPLQVKKQINIASSHITICMVSFSFEQSLWSCIEAGSAKLFLMHYKLSATLGVCVRTHLLYVELIHVLYIVRLFSYELNRIKDRKKEKPRQGRINKYKKSKDFSSLFFFLAFDFCRFCVVIRFFHPCHNSHWPPTSKDFLSQILSITFIFIS